MSMTAEEAGQTILEGVMWCACPKCDGSGDEEQLAANGDYMGLFDCSQCHGSGKAADPVYVEACQVLERTVPLAPLLGMMERATQRTKRQIQEHEDRTILAIMNAATPGEPSDT